MDRWGRSTVVECNGWSLLQQLCCHWRRFNESDVVVINGCAHFLSHTLVQFWYLAVDVHHPRVEVQRPNFLIVESTYWKPLRLWHAMNVLLSCPDQCLGRWVWALLLLFWLPLQSLNFAPISMLLPGRHRIWVVSLFLHCWGCDALCEWELLLLPADNWNPSKNLNGLPFVAFVSLNACSWTPLCYCQNDPNTTPHFFKIIR